MEQQKDLPVHPAANLFRMMNDEEYQGLLESIRERGLKTPLAIYKGQLLDGRNRLRACRELGITPQYAEVLVDGSPTQYVVEMNLHRRHLEDQTSVRAALAVEMEPLLEAEAKARHRFGSVRGAAATNSKRVRLTLGEPANSQETQDHDSHSGKWKTVAAKAMKVGRASVENAAAVKRADPEAFERIKRGEVAVNTAYNQVAAGKFHRSERHHRTEHDRFIRLMASVSGTAENLTKHLNLEIVYATVSEKDRKYWAGQIRKAAAELRQFSSRLYAAKTSQEKAS